MSSSNAKQKGLSCARKPFASLLACSNARSSFELEKKEEKKKTGKENELDKIITS